MTLGLGRSDLRPFLIENKSTVKESLSIKREWLRKITIEANTTGKAPALAIQFTDADGVPKRSGKWIAIPEDIFMELLEDAE